MALLPAVAFAPFLLENDDLIGAALIDDFACDSGVGYQRSADFYVIVVADKQDIRHSYLLAHCKVELLDLDHISFRDAVLLTAGSNYCIFHRISPKVSI